MNTKHIALFALLACLTGCLPVDSLNSLYTDKDVVFDESLLGFWVGPKNGEDGGLEFSPLEGNGPKGYVLTMYDKAKGSQDGDKMVFHAHLVNLGGRRFLDAVPEHWDAQSDSYPLQLKSGKGNASIEPRLLRLASSAYLEFARGTTGNSNQIQANLRRAHWILKVTRNEKKLQLDWADDDDFKKAVVAGKVDLSTALLKSANHQNVVITASTPELQKFVLEHADDGTFFNSKPGELHLKD